MTPDISPLGNLRLIAPWESDASRLRTWLRCNRRWLYSSGLGLEAAGENSGGDLLFGSLVHSSLESWDRLLTITDWHDEKILVNILESAWESSAAWDSHPDLATGPKTRDSLIRLLIWYAEQFGGREDSIKPACLNGDVLVEVPFSIAASDLAASLGLAGLDFGQWPQPPRITGRLDGVVWGLGEGESWVRERKTTGSALSSFYFARYSPEVQTSIYPMVARYLFPNADIQGVLLEAIQVGVSFARMQRVELRRHPDQLRESLVSIARAFREMAAAGVGQFAADENHYPINESACVSGGRPCPFRALCLDRPANRPAAIASNFQFRTPWNPLEYSSNITVLTAPVNLD